MGTGAACLWRKGLWRHRLRLPRRGLGEAAAGRQQAEPRELAEAELRELAEAERREEAGAEQRRR